MYRVTIPGRPVVKKNSKRIIGSKLGRPRIIASRQYLEWERMATDIVNNSRPPSFRKCDLYLIAYVYYFGVAPDLGNALEGILDVMEQCGVYHNDRQIAWQMAERHRVDNRDEQRITVVVGRRK